MHQIHRSHEDDDQIPTIQELYPHFTKKQQQEAKENLQRYAHLMLRMYKRQLRERYGDGLDQLTQKERDAITETRYRSDDL